MPKRRIGAGGPFLVPARLSTAIFLIPINLAISAGFEEIATPPAWTRSSVQPPLAAPAFGRAINTPQSVDQTPAWLHPVAGTPLPSGQYFGRTINEPDDPLPTPSWVRSSAKPAPVPQPFARVINEPDDPLPTPQWLRPSIVPPLVPANISIGGFDEFNTEGWFRNAAQSPAAAVGQPFGRAITQPDPSIATPGWTKGSPQTPVTPDVGQVFGRAVSEPYVTIPTPPWLRPSIRPPLVPVNISIGGFEDGLNVPAWIRAGSQGPVTVTGTTAIVDARHRDNLATPGWTRSTPTATPIFPVPPAGTVVIGAEWPHQPAFVWLHPTPTGTPATPAANPPAGTVLIVAPYPHEAPAAWMASSSTLLALPIPPAPGLGGSVVIHPRKVYVKGDRRKPRTFIDKIGEPFIPLERTAEPVPNAASAAPPPVNTAPVRDALVSRLPAPLGLPVSPAHVVKVIDDEDDDLLLLS